MMELDLYQIDAFAEKVFEGNPAAVCPLDEWLPADVMQKIARENNLSETAFFVSTKHGFKIRWFTPESEVDLCGHATLASAWVLFNMMGYQKERIVFESRSGNLTVAREGVQLVMDFPAQPPEPCNPPADMEKAFGRQPLECLEAADYLFVFESRAAVESIKPDVLELMNLDRRGVIITAEAADYDFVARFFAPKLGVYEDPVTGSAYTQLAPYWADRLGKKRLRARQVSFRGGNVTCEVAGDRVFIAGTAVKYMEGKITLDL
jgi:PhzF family phenazine biosynthesis protein